MPRLVLDGPLSTLTNAPESSPRSLTDARSQRRGVIVPERDGSEGPEVIGAPLGRVGSSLVSTNGTGDFSALDALVRTGQDWTGAGVDGATPRLLRIKEDGATTDIPSVTSLSSLTYDNWANSTLPAGLSQHGSTEYVVGYWVVPVNDRDEAGAGFGVQVTKFGLAAATVADWNGVITHRITLTLAVNAATSKCEVYKTFLSSPQLGAAHTAVGIGKSDGPMVPGGQLFYLGEHQADDGVVTVEDATDFYDAGALAVLNASRTGVEEITEGVLTDTIGGVKTRVTEIVVPSEPYARPINVWSRSAEQFSAGCLHWAGGRLFAGDVAWRTKPPQALFNWDNGSGTAYPVQVRREYVVGGETYLGPATTFDGPDGLGNGTKSLLIQWEGETAIRVYVDNGAGYQEYERIVPDGRGIYRTAYVKETETLASVRSQLTFDADAFDASRLSAASPTTTTAIEEPLAVFVSNTHRPREMTFEQFVLPHGDRVRMLAPSRLSEAEGLKGYDFITGSSTGLWVVENTEGYPLTAVTEAFGVAESSLTGRPMWAPVEAGLALVGTDGRLHLIAGRQATPLDSNVPRLWSEINGIAYDAVGQEKEPLLQVLTDTGLWGFSFLRQGFVAHRSVEGGRWVFFDGDGLLVGTTGSTTEVVDGSGAVRTARVITQRLLEEPPPPPKPQEHGIRSISMDYDGGVYDPSVSATLLFAIRHPGVVQLDGSGGGPREGRFTAAPMRPRYPRFRGLGWQLGCEGFTTEFRAFVIQPSP